MQIPVGKRLLSGDLLLPLQAKGLILFAHGSGSTRLSPRNQFVARSLQAKGFGTLLFDLLTKEEETLDSATSEIRFNIDLLTARLKGATEWIRQEHSSLPLGYFGASTGAAAALRAAALLEGEIKAIVSRSGRPDLTGNRVLCEITVPTLLIVGSLDEAVIEMNQKALEHLKGPKKLEIVAGATHQFEEKGKLEVVARLAGEWFEQYLK